jgi:hypothetical protein
MGLLEARDKEGNPVMRVINMRRQCLACEHREKRTQQEVECNHVAQRPLSFRSRSDENRLQAFLTPFGEAAHASEMLNRRAADTSRAFFDASTIDATLASNAHRIPQLAQMVHWFVLSMDPAGTVLVHDPFNALGSDRGTSESSLVAMTYVRVLPRLATERNEPQEPDIPRSVTLPTQMHAVVRVRHFVALLRFGPIHRRGEAVGGAADVGFPRARDCRPVPRACQARDRPSESSLREDQSR